MDSYENDEWESVITDESRLKYKAAAKANFYKDKRVNIRIAGKVLEMIQERV